MALLVAGEGGVGRVEGVGGTRAAAGLAAENLAEKVEERQQLLDAADHVEGQHEVTRLPGQGSGGAVLLRVFLGEGYRIDKLGIQKNKWV